jgi:hypothetical protein
LAERSVRLPIKVGGAERGVVPCVLAGLLRRRSWERRSASSYEKRLRTRSVRTSP